MIAGLAISLVGIPSAAHAEGSFSTYIKQGQPGFSSRIWNDYNVDGASTIVTLTGCKANKPGAASGTTSVSSVKVSLYRNDIFVKAISRACGTYNFGRQGSGYFRFAMSAINGTTAFRSIFLNVSTVKVQY